MPTAEGDGELVHVAPWPATHDDAARQQAAGQEDEGRPGEAVGDAPERWASPGLAARVAARRLRCLAAGPPGPLPTGPRRRPGGCAEAHRGQGQRGGTSPDGQQRRGGHGRHEGEAAGAARRSTKRYWERVAMASDAPTSRRWPRRPRAGRRADVTTRALVPAPRMYVVPQAGQVADVGGAHRAVDRAGHQQVSAIDVAAARPGRVEEGVLVAVGHVGRECGEPSAARGAGVGLGRPPDEPDHAGAGARCQAQASTSSVTMGPMTKRMRK